MIASYVQKTVPIPGRSGHTVTIKKLGWKALERAEHIVIERGLAMIREHGMTSFNEQVRANGGEDAVRNADPFFRHDAMTMLTNGVIRWTLPAPINADAIGALDESTRFTLAREIFNLSTSQRSSSHGR